MVGTTIVLSRIPVIKFRKGGIGGSSAPSVAAKPVPAVSAAIPVAPAAAAPTIAAPKTAVATASTASHQPMVNIALY